MGSRHALEVDGLWKQYRYGVIGHGTLRKDLQAWWARRRGQEDPNALVTATARRGRDGEPFWALRDVSFQVAEGEVLGIVGRNGAGKSTLLKILSRVTTPTRGEIRLRGRLSSLLEVGTGFHPELTGRENIFLNGAILGMSRQDITARFDEIVSFAEIDDFIDTPVKRYSSGMYVRLAFAVAAHLETDILLLDEVLAVGDVQFRRKCLGKMGDVARRGRTVVFVSHDATALQQLCTIGIWLSEGRLRQSGSASEVIASYLAAAMTKAASGPASLGPSLQLGELRMRPDPVVSGQPLSVTVELRSSRRLRITELCLLVYAPTGARVGIVDLRTSAGPYQALSDSVLQIEGRIETLPLVEGRYTIGLFVDSGEVREDFLDLQVVDVLSADIQSGLSAYSPAVRGYVEFPYRTVEVRQHTLNETRVATGARDPV